MKLRLLDDSIRLRLSQSEVTAADEVRSVEACTRFPDGSSFHFVLRSDADLAGASAAFGAEGLVVSLPSAEISAWARDDQAVSLHREIALPGGSTLTLLVEKDFRCLTPRDGEDQSDLFRNPDSAC